LRLRLVCFDANDGLYMAVDGDGGPPLSSFVLMMTVVKSDEVDKDDFTNSELI
jgi:hypothetical protein